MRGKQLHWARSVSSSVIHSRALDGDECVRHVLRSFCGEIAPSVHSIGLRTLEEVNRGAIVKEEDLHNGVARKGSLTDGRG